MSRALDQHVVESLKQGNHQQVYRDIVSVLNESSVDELLEIEFLGSSQPLQESQSFLQDGLAIAIPKLRLVQAFLVARSILRSHLEREYYPDEALLAATTVILLMDPEHLTAANTRKRILLSILSTPTKPQGLLIREKWIVDSLLTSRLHRHTKSPTLWSHRRWLLQQMQHIRMVVDVPGDLKSIIAVSGERHPKNYYAWSHARWLLETFESQMGQSTADKVASDVHDWCLKHHTDISGWCFLLSILDGLIPCSAEARSDVFLDTLKLTSSFRWRNESVWWFLRTFAASMSLSDAERATFEQTQTDLATDSSGSVVLSNAIEFCNQMRKETTNP